MQAVNEINAGFAIEVYRPADVQLSKPNLMDVFVAYIRGQAYLLAYGSLLYAFGASFRPLILLG